VTNGAVTTTSRVAAGGSVRLNIVPGAPVGHRIALFSPASGHFVSVAVTGGALAAESDARELFDVYDAGYGNIALKSETRGRFVTVALDGGHSLQAQGATTIGPREQLRWRNQTSGAFALAGPTSKQ
jgi:hypothetical protein